MVSLQEQLMNCILNFKKRMFLKLQSRCFQPGELFFESMIFVLLISFRKLTLFQQNRMEYWSVNFIQISSKKKSDRAHLIKYQAVTQEPISGIPIFFTKNCYLQKFDQSQNPLNETRLVTKKESYYLKILPTQVSFLYLLILCLRENKSIENSINLKNSN